LTSSSTRCWPKSGNRHRRVLRHILRREESSLSAQSRKILNAARENGLRLKIHADEVQDLVEPVLLPSSESVAEHLLAAAEKTSVRCGRAGSIAVLLPATAYSLKNPYGQRQRDDRLGSSGRARHGLQPRIMLLRCRFLSYSASGVSEHGYDCRRGASAATLNAAYAINRQHKVGSLEPGKQGRLPRP
jgi:imidazolonepropionase